MIDKKDFRKMKKELEGFEHTREQVIQTSRLIIKASKQIIYSLHRDDLKNALFGMDTMKKLIKKLPDARYDTDISRVARQEYAEAASYLTFIKEGRIPTCEEVGVGTEEYLLGICDLTGELMRKAVKDTIRNKPESAQKIRETVEELYGLFLEFDLRNGELRKKSDQIKWNLAKLEDMALR